ncbi:MAG: acyl carrier protein [Syntrophus sp. PtaB.Bin001]|nr:MAG: acyl carrier protein [Syntrophus sp. PtaB.Bin001]
MKKEIREFIEREIMKDERGGILKDTDPLIESGIIDSLGIQILLAHLEETYSVHIPDEELIPENFETVESIVALVERVKG